MILLQLLLLFLRHVDVFRLAAPEFQIDEGGTHQEDTEDQEGTDAVDGVQLPHVP